MATIARGQITIVDLNDAVAINSMLTTNVGLTQLYNKDTKTYTPNWSTGSFLVITPEVFVAGTTSSVMSRVTSPKWTVNGKAVSEVGGTAASSAPYALTIKQNMTAATSYNVQFEGTYTDPESGLTTPVKAVITLNKVETGTASPVLTVQQPQGMDFINDTPESLQAVAYFLRGGQEDTTNVTYKWEKQESSGSWTAITNAGGFSGATTKTLTLTKDAVLNFLNVRVTITDTDSGSATFNKTFIAYASFRDASDPIQVHISSSTGDKIVNGQGNTELTAELWRAGVEIDKEGTGYTYTWYKHDKTGTADEDWNTTGSKTGKKITVPAADIDQKATFVCDVSKGAAPAKLNAMKTTTEK